MRRKEVSKYIFTIIIIKLLPIMIKNLMFRMPIPTPDENQEFRPFLTFLEIQLYFDFYSIQVFLEFFYTKKIMREVLFTCRTNFLTFKRTESEVFNPNIFITLSKILYKLICISPSKCGLKCIMIK